MKRCLIILMASFLAAIQMTAQDRRVQNKPYIDLRPMHFGIHVGFNLQDIELQNTGPQTIALEDGTLMQQHIVTDADKWSPGFSVGVLADLRLSDHLNVRISPTMHFGAKHLTFLNLTDLDPEGFPHEETQDLKSTYMSFPIDLKFSAERWNNSRPYIIAGVNPMINLTGKNQDYIRLKRSDLFLEFGVGCDLYLPFFKLIPELKFCFSLMNTFDRSHAHDLLDANKRFYANAVNSISNKMVVLTFYFE